MRSNRPRCLTTGATARVVCGRPPVYADDTTRGCSLGGRAPQQSCGGRGSSPRGPTCHTERRAAQSPRPARPVATLLIARGCRFGQRCIRSGGRGGHRTGCSIGNYNIIIPVNLRDDPFRLHYFLNSDCAHPQQASYLLVRPVWMSPCHRHRQPSPLLLLEWRLGRVGVRIRQISHMGYLPFH